MRPFPLDLDDRLTICRGLRCLKTLTSPYDDRTFALRERVGDLLHRLDVSEEERAEPRPRKSWRRFRGT